MPWRVLQHRNFFLLFAASLVSEIGSRIHRIALLVLVYALTSTAWWVSLTLAAQLVATVVVGPMVAAWAETQDQRRLVIATNVLRAVLVVLIPLVGTQSLGVLLVLVFAVEVLRSVHDPVVNALIPAMTPPHQLDDANGLMLFTQRFAEVAFVGVAGVLVAAVGPALAFWIDALSYILAAAIVLRLPHLEANAATNVSYWSRLRQGVGYVYQQPIIRRTVGTLFVAALFGSVDTVLMVVLALSVLQVGAAGFGVIEGAMALGAVLGTLVVPKLTATIARERLFLYGILCFGIFELSIGLLPVFGWVVLAYLMSGIANMAFIVPLRSIMQTHTAPDMRTRAFAALTAVANSAVLAGTMLTGALEPSLGAPRLFIVAGAIVAATAVWRLVKGHLATKAPNVAADV